MSFCSILYFLSIFLCLFSMLLYSVGSPLGFALNKLAAVLSFISLIVSLFKGVYV